MNAGKPWETTKRFLMRGKRSGKDHKIRRIVDRRREAERKRGETRQQQIE